MWMCKRVSVSGESRVYPSFCLQDVDRCSLHEVMTISHMNWQCGTADCFLHMQRVLMDGRPSVCFLISKIQTSKQITNDNMFLEVLVGALASHSISTVSNYFLQRNWLDNPAVLHQVLLWVAKQGGAQIVREPWDHSPALGQPWFFLPVLWQSYQHDLFN